MEYKLGSRLVDVEVLAAFMLGFEPVIQSLKRERASAPWASLTQVDPADLGELSGIDRLGIRIVILILINIYIYIIHKYALLTPIA